MKLTKEHLYDAVEQLKRFIDETDVPIIYLTKDEYTTLITEGTVTTSSGKTYKYDDDAYYAFEGTSSGDTSTSIMINEVHNYSTEEHIVGTWIDGKPIYEKTVYIPALPSEANKETYYSHNIENIDTICNFVGTAYWSNGNTAILNHLTTNAEYDSTGNISITVDKTNIRIAPRADRSSMYAYVTIRYTKVNDSPITPQSTLESAINQTTFSSLSTQAKDLVGAINEVNKSHSYSTEEQVVGTWIDGKPVYQKTLVGIITEEITRLDIDSNYRILEVDGFIVRNRDGEAFNCRSQDGSYSIDIKVGIHHQILIILSTTMLIESWLTTDNNVYVTIQYTKTTD